ncbi:transposase [Halovulum dunhuangense]|uniref:Transposase n=1 Tax=Halovulum dunhuangense TaxID=1505036 RepID=A0A849L6Z5_9RHOB|nr:transposase [Halovulum dunhuangense]
MKAVAAERRRFGYRRIHVMLERQGIVMNLKKLRRLYREEKCQSARNLDPLSASKNDPLGAHGSWPDAV